MPSSIRRLLKGTLLAAALAGPLVALADPPPPGQVRTPPPPGLIGGSGGGGVPVDVPEFDPSVAGTIATLLGVAAVVVARRRRS